VFDRFELESDALYLYDKSLTLPQERGILDSGRLLNVSLYNISYIYTIQNSPTHLGSTNFNKKDNSRERKHKIFRIDSSTSKVFLTDQSDDFCSRI
jgi:hypothetical protein